MKLPTFTYHAPTTLEQAFGLLAEYEGNCKLLAGGTDVFPALKTARLAVDHIINVRGIEELTELGTDAKGALRIGAATSLTDVENHPTVRESYPALEASIWELATKQVRNKGTVVGNLCNASPAADTATPLMAYGAIAEIVGPAGTREVPVEDLITGPGRTCLAATELVRAIRIPAPAAGTRSIYLKFSPRSKVDIAAVNLAATLVLDAEDQVTGANIFLGTVAPVPMRAARAANLLIGKELTDAQIEVAATEAGSECSPITDFRATAEYKRRIVGVLCRRALENLQTLESGVTS